MSRDSVNWYILNRLMGKNPGSTLRNVGGAFVFQLAGTEEFEMGESLCQVLDRSWKKWGDYQPPKSTKKDS